MREDEDGWITIESWFAPLHCRCGREWGAGQKIWQGGGTGYLYCPSCLPPRQVVEQEAERPEPHRPRRHQREADWMRFE